LPDAVAAWPAGIAAGVGIAATLFGAAPVAIRNARIPPIAALREAVAPALRMTAPRWILAALVAVGACAELPLLRGAEGGTISAYLVLFTITLIPLFAVCSPAIAVLSVVGLTLTYTAISIAVTFAMSTAHRRRELAATRLAGASRAQTLGMVALDVLFVIVIAVIQAAAITAR
jgi:hypothetical protein